VEGSLYSEIQSPMSESAEIYRRASAAPEALRCLTMAKKVRYLVVTRRTDVVQPKALTVAAPTDKTGYIVKKSNDSKKWKQMYFVLNVTKKLLYSYENEAVCLRPCVSGLTCRPSTPRASLT
jgi:hypothetical protein